MESNLVGGSFISRGEKSSSKSDAELFDRIINLKFITRNGKSFAIRSDYEPVFHRDNTMSFKPCTQKPDIKVSYKQVAQGVGIQVDIYVTNFFIGNADTLNEDGVFTAHGDPIKECVIQMGYRKQFPDWRKIANNDNIDDYYEMVKNPRGATEVLNSFNEITVQILTGYPESYPPDRVLYFKGIIGNIQPGLKWTNSLAAIDPSYGAKNFPKDLASELQAVLFQLITRRFVNSNRAINRVEVERVNGEEVRNLYVRKQSLHSREAAWEKVKLEDGILPIMAAYGEPTATGRDGIGTLCIVSKHLRDMPINAVYGREGFDLSQEELDLLRPIPLILPNDMQDGLTAQLIALEKHYPFLRYYMLPDGDIFFYHEDEEDDEIWSDPFVKKKQVEGMIKQLPAIYDMTPAGTRVIRCPFMAFLGPMYTVQFESRYLTGGTIVSFYYPPDTNSFLVIFSTVTFATVQDFNSMELTCVDLPKSEITEDSAGNHVVNNVPPKTEPPEDAQTTHVVQMRHLWKTRKISVSLFAGVTGAGVEHAVKKYYLDNAPTNRWDEGTVITEKMALEAFKEDNKDNWEAWLAVSNSEEDSNGGIGERCDIRVPKLKAGYVLTIRSPFQQTYDPADEVTG